MEYRYILAGRSLALDPDRCVGCGRCREVCPHGVFVLEAAEPEGAGGRAVARIAARERCMECGACARNCPSGAIAVTAGVGCAAAVIGGFFNGGVPVCGCGGDSQCGEGGDRAARSARCC